MVSKPKSKTYIVHHRVGSLCKGRYRVGARNPKEAEDLLRKLLGKHMTTKMYYEVKDTFMPHGTIIEE